MNPKIKFVGDGCHWRRSALEMALPYSGFMLTLDLNDRPALVDHVGSRVAERLTDAITSALEVSGLTNIRGERDLALDFRPDAGLRKALDRVANRKLSDDDWDRLQDVPLLSPADGVIRVAAADVLEAVMGEAVYLSCDTSCDWCGRGLEDEGYWVGEQDRICRCCQKEDPKGFFELWSDPDGNDDRLYPAYPGDIDFWSLGAHFTERFEYASGANPHVIGDVIRALGWEVLFHRDHSGAFEMTWSPWVRGYIYPTGLNWLRRVAISLSERDCAVMVDDELVDRLNRFPAVDPGLNQWPTTKGWTFRLGHRCLDDGCLDASLLGTTSHDRLRRHTYTVIPGRSPEQVVLICRSDVELPASIPRIK